MLTETVSSASLPLSFTVLFLSGLLVRILTRQLSHPLRIFPGPRLNRISEIPAALALVRGEQHVYYRSLHEEYGPVVRVSPNELSFIGVDAREEIYGFRKGGPLMEKSPIFLGAVGKVNGETGVSLALNKEHARQRRALGYLFSGGALSHLETLVHTHIDKFIAALQGMASEGNAADFSDWYSYLMFDVMGDICFAEPFGCLDQAAGTDWSTSVIKVFEAATWMQGIRRLSGVDNWLESTMARLLIPPIAAAWRKIHLDNTREKTLRRLADPDREHKDFMYHILNNESKHSLSQNEIVLNIALFISAGTDTTATALTGWTYLMCTNPLSYKRVIEEIRSTFDSADDIRWDKVKELSYLDATVNEALRLFPPSPASQQRVVPVGGATIGGHYVPEGTTVAVPPWVSTHSELNFHEPDSFKPERWLKEGYSFENDDLQASVPFGNGPRICLGKNLAYMEMRLIAAHVLWAFDVKLDKGEHRAANQVWGLDGQMRHMEVFHSMTKPPLWIQMSSVHRR